MSRNPTDDMPSCEAESCDVGGCREPWAWEPESSHGPRKVRLCEHHADEWLTAERDLLAEREEMAGREKVVTGYAPLFGLARAFDTRGRKSA
jgi:hypothetical protein